jgi:hypothetical protein
MQILAVTHPGSVAFLNFHYVAGCFNLGSWTNLLRNWQILAVTDTSTFYGRLFQPWTNLLRN